MEIKEFKGIKYKIKYLENDQAQIILEEETLKKFMESTKMKLKGEFPLNPSMVFKKLGGTNISQVLNKNKYADEFQAWADISKLGLPFVTNKYVEAGKILEPKIINKCQELMPKSKIVGFEAKEVGFDMFTNNNYFGGVIDAIVEDKQIIVECKVQQAKNKIEWDKQIPEHYLLQGLLYAKLKGFKKIVFAVCFLISDLEYDVPSMVEIQFKNNLFFYTVEIDDKMEQEIEKYMKEAKEWYIKHITKGISPIFSTKLPSSRWETDKEKLLKQLGILFKKGE